MVEGISLESPLATQLKV